MISTTSISIVAFLFAQPLQVPTRPASLLWALPICMSIAVVYKAIKLEQFKGGLFLREVLLLFGTIVGFLVLVALGLLVIAYLTVGL